MDLSRKVTIEMNLKSLPDLELLSQTKSLATQERKIGIEVLHHLREIEARRLFASLGFSSLFEYCVKELGYAGGSAHRRISAMRLLREIPEYESKLQEGTVTVSSLSQLQGFLVQEKRQIGKVYPKEAKIELLEQIEGKSFEQTARVLAAISPEQIRPEKAKVLNEEDTEIRFTADRALMAKLERLKNLMGHQAHAQTYAGLIGELADLALKKLDPLQKRDLHQKEAAPSINQAKSLPPSEVKEAKVKEAKVKEAKVKEAKVKEAKIKETEVKKMTVMGTVLEKRVRQNRYIPEKTRRFVWQRDQGRCSFVDQKSGRSCESRHALQIDHIHPVGKGGTSEVGNLRLLCAAHNQFAAIESYGAFKMQEFCLK
jgi:5-methylcytosine-specific restriction endonuclease McrA